MSAHSSAFFGPDRRKKQVLIVEDNHMDTALFTALLESQGHGVLTAVNAADGLRMAREHHPDLVIMDVRLPDLSGFEATRILKDDEATREIPVIVTSAYGPYADKDEVHECGCDAYMATPIEIGGFVDLIHSFLSKSSAAKVG